MMSRHDDMPHGSSQAELAAGTAVTFLQPSGSTVKAVVVGPPRESTGMGCGRWGWVDEQYPSNTGADGMEEGVGGGAWRRTRNPRQIPPPPPADSLDQNFKPLRRGFVFRGDVYAMIIRSHTKNSANGDVQCGC